MKIISISPLLVSSPYGDGNVLGQPLGVKTLGFVRVELDNGLTGYGEAYAAIYMPENFRDVANYISSIFIGKEFTSPLDLYDSFHIPFVSRSGFFASVYSAFDIAFWDIFCQVTNVPLYQHINPNSSPNLSLPRLYFSGGSAAFSNDAILADISSLDYRLFSAYKMRIGRQSWMDDVDRMSTALKELSDIPLMVDAIMGSIRPPLSIHDWKSRSEDFNFCSLYWLEEPLHPDDYNNLITLRSILNTPLAAGEALSGCLDLVSYCNAPGLDYLQLDATHIGGITPILKLSECIMHSSKKVAMHVWGSPNAFIVNLHVAVALGADWLEYPSVQLDLSNNLSPSYYSCSFSLSDFLLMNSLSFPLNDSILNQYVFVPKSGFRF